jgi:hypothetical protein
MITSVALVLVIPLPLVNVDSLHCYQLVPIVDHQVNVAGNRRISPSCFSLNILLISMQL